MGANYEVRGDVAVISLDNPPVNGLGYDTRLGIVDGLERALGDAAVKAIVVTGAGKAFSGGADIREFGSPKAIAEPNLLSVIAALEASPKPVVAAVHSVAMGGGLELALGCHYRVAAPGAQIALPEVKIGLIPGAGGTQRLARLVGPAKAKDLIFSGRMVDAEEALRIGLADRVAPAAEVYATAEALVRPYVNGPELALRAAKQAIDSGLSMDLANGLALESQLFASLFATEDMAEGTAAFVAKRKPTFTGR